jgi:elongation factor Ts
VTGKMNKFFATNCLLEQGFVKNPDISIKDHVASVAQALGDEITVAKFLRFQIGESF